MASPDVSLVVSTVMISSLELNDKLFVAEMLGNGKLPLIPNAGSHDSPPPAVGELHRGDVIGTCVDRERSFSYLESCSAVKRRFSLQLGESTTCWARNRSRRVRNSFNGEHGRPYLLVGHHFKIGLVSQLCNTQGFA